MIAPEHTQVIKNVLDDYAQALNSADLAAIPSFYTQDGQFMPEGYQTISKATLLKKSVGNHLANASFHIEYNIDEILVEKDFAFVVANAKTLQKEGNGETLTGKTSRDLFILKMVDDKWKISRYIFNNVKII